MLAGTPLQPLLSMFVLALILTGIAVRSRTKKERDGIRAAVASVVARAFPWTRRPHPPPHRPAVCSGSRGQSQAPVRVRVTGCVALGLGALARTGTASPSSPFRGARLWRVGPACLPNCARASWRSSAAPLSSLPPLHPSLPRKLQRLWTLGAAEVDQRLSRGLDAASLHEVKAEPIGRCGR